jgi:hypothetical protein
LERQWKFNTGGWLKDGVPAVPENWYRRATGNYQPGVSPLSKKFHALRTDERECNRPSLILSPMLVEDCRRLLITNLSMDWFTETQSNHLNPSAWYQPANHPNRVSIPAIEFWRYFPDARDKFEIGTGARMAATFPFVGPAVSLPTIPPRRVVDAGYFDNYGMNLAAVWLYKHREFIKEHTSGVVIIEIRAYPRRNEKLRFDTRDPNKGPLKPESFNWAVAEAGTPFTALYNLYARSAYFRNDQAIDILNQEFNTPNDKQFFTTVCFECEQGGSLSWTLPKGDFDAIRSEFDKPSEANPPEVKAKRQLIQDTVAKLKDWFGDGGTR